MRSWCHNHLHATSLVKATSSMRLHGQQHVMQIKHQRVIHKMSTGERADQTGHGSTIHSCCSHDS